MTNKEYVIQNHIDDLLSVITEYGTCGFCETVGCKKYCHSDKSPRSCEETFEAWLKMEHVEPLLFPLDTIVEVTTVDKKTLIGYYNGVDKFGNHCICSYKENVGKMNGDVPWFFTRIHPSDAPKVIKKVGD